MSDKPKVLIVATHPIQYQVPWFRYLEENVDDYDFEVLYLMIPNAKQQGTGFGQSFEWDVPLLEGYRWKKINPEFLSAEKNLDDFSAIRIKNSKRLIKQSKADIVFLTGWQCSALIQILIACKILNVPTVIRGESNNLKPRNAIKKIIHRLLLKQFDKYLSIGTANKNFYLENKIKSKNIYDCPYFVDNGYFTKQLDSNETKPSEIRTKFDIPKEKLCFCFVGKLNQKKRILDILKALAVSNNSHIHLLVVGNGELMQQAQAYAKEHELGVSFAGFLNQSEITQAYLAADAIILASDYDETWGLVVNEAMACGLPAIVSDRCGCNQDLIIENETGYRFEYNNINELAKKMSLMAKLNPEELKELGKNAQKLVTGSYSIEQATLGLIKALNDC